MGTSRRCAVATAVALPWLISATALAAPPVCSDPLLAESGVALPLIGNFEPDRLRALAGVMGKIESGNGIQVVTLGDSIVGDTFGPQFGRSGIGTSTAWGFDRVASHYSAAIHTVVSVLGSTGAWYYQDAVRLQQYVLAYAPDLLVIGGISNRGDIDAIRSVIAQTRAAVPGVEFLLMTGAVDLDAVPTGSDLEIEPQPGSYRANLRALAIEQNAAFLDLRATYDRFIAAAHAENPAVDHAYFQRDAIHANAAGRELLREAVTTFLLPDRACESAVSPGPAETRTATVMDFVDEPHGVLDIAAADFEGNGTVEVALMHGSRTPTFYRLPPAARGPAAFVTASGRSLATEAAVGDFSGDGIPDVVTAAPGLPLEMHSLSGVAGSSWSPAGFIVETTSALDSGDYDGDGRRDIVSANQGLPDRLYLNRTVGASTAIFEPHYLPGAVSESTDIALVDVDGDTLADIVTAGVSGMPNTPAVLVLLNRGFAAGVPEIAEIPIAHGISDARKLAVGDVDADGDADIAVGTGLGHASIHIYFQTMTPGQFESTPLRLPKTDPDACAGILELLDYDDDGLTDIVTGGSCREEIDLRPPNRGVYYFRQVPGANGRRFEPPVWLSPGTQAVAADVYDVDSDGVKDLLVANGAAGDGGRVKVVLGAFAGLPPDPGPAIPPTAPPPATAAHAGGGSIGWRGLLLLLATVLLGRARPGRSPGHKVVTSACCTAVHGEPQTQLQERAPPPSYPAQRMGLQ